MAAAASPTDGEATVVAGDAGLNLPTDAFAEILLRLPPSCRRWVRLVCRHWRDVVDERTPPSQPPKVLACFTGTESSSAHVVDDLAYGRCREVWGVTRRHVSTSVVGTCNGLLCLWCGVEEPGGAIALVNPLTRETLAAPPLPAPSFRSHFRSWQQYSFGFHPATGLYKIVHLPCDGDRTGGFNVLQVFTLGDASWRDVAVPGASCCLDAGLVSVGGATYWVTKGAERVVAFDLRDERVAFDAPLPAGTGPGYICRLTEYHGRLGLAVSADRRAPARTEVWVLGDGEDPQGWTRRYSVRVHGVEQRLAGPYFAHGGEYVLTSEIGGSQVYAHRLRGAGAGRLPCGEVRSVRIAEPGEVAVPGCTSKEVGYYNLRTFAYVDTKEPLSIYKIDHHTRKVDRQIKSGP